MDYTYYPPPLHQQYPPFQTTTHPHQTQVSQHTQFQHRPGEEHFEAPFQPFDSQLHFDPSTLIGVHSSPSPGHYTKHAIDSHGSDCGGINSHGITRITLANGTEDLPTDKSLLNGSGEEKEILTPAQCRRKEQNRAAQRAFRERKERRVRDLERELNKYKSNYSSLMEDHKSLKRQIEKVATENEILRATSNNNDTQGSITDCGPNRVTTPTGLLRNLTDYSARSGDKKELAHRTARSCKAGEKLLDASATWDLVVRHLSSRGVKLDVQDIYDRLKGHLRDGQYPVVDEAHVLRAIEESAAAGNDELI